MDAFYCDFSYAGLRAGGGIGDEMDPPGEDDFLARFAFDITFFFFIIVIILAIIQVNKYLNSKTN
jgi:ryanodine receptor 2